MILDYKLDGQPAANHYKVLLLMFDASKADASSPDVQYARGYYTPRQLGDTFFSDANGVQAFMNEASYGRVSFSGRVVGWMDLGPQTTAATTIQQTYNTYAEQATAYATFSDYDIVYFVFLTDAGDQLQVGWQIKVNQIDTSQGRAFVGIDFMINSWFFLQAGSPAYFSAILPSRSWAHELVHTLGSFGHDVALDCGTATLASACAVNGYGNPFSLMGESAFGNHPAISVKEYLKWTTADQVPHISASGDYALCPSETVDTGKKGIVIPLKTPITLTSTTGEKDVTFDRINVEYRRALGFDRYEDRLQSHWLDYFKTDGPVRADGVLLTLGYQDTTFQATALLDMHPASSYVTSTGIEIAGNTGKFADAMLWVGESFHVPGQTTTITVKELTTDGGIRVHVDY
jgi:hypothetical protein